MTYQWGELLVVFDNSRNDPHRVIPKTLLSQVELPLLQALIPHNHLEKSQHLISWWGNFEVLALSLEEIKQVLPINPFDDRNELKLTHMIHYAVWLKLFRARKAVISPRYYRSLVPWQILPRRSETGIVDVIFYGEEWFDSMVVPEDQWVEESFFRLLVAEGGQLSFWDNLRLVPWVGRSLRFLWCLGEDLSRHKVAFS